MSLALALDHCLLLLVSASHPQQMERPDLSSGAQWGTMDGPNIGNALQGKDNRDHHGGGGEVGFPWQGAMETQGLGAQQILLCSLRNWVSSLTEHPLSLEFSTWKAFHAPQTALLPTGD